MSNTKSIENNNNSDLIQGPCQVNQSDDLNQAIDKDKLIATTKTFIDNAEFDFEKNPISETCRFLSLKAMVVSDPIERYHGSKEAAEIISKVFDDYLANEMSKREKSKKKIFFNKATLPNTIREHVIDAVKEIASDYIYSTKWAENGDTAAEYARLQSLEIQAQEEVTRLYGLYDELIDTVSSVFKEFYESHPTIFFPTKPLERTCNDEDAIASVEKIAKKHLEAAKFSTDEDPSVNYKILQSVEKQISEEVTSLYGQEAELLDMVSGICKNFSEAHRYNFFTGNKEHQEITDPVCASEDTDEKEEAMELACSTEDTDAKQEESPEEESEDVIGVLIQDEKSANVTKIANECFVAIRFNPDDGKLVESLRVLDAERKAVSRVKELYGEDHDALEELDKFFKRCYEAVEQFYSDDFKEEALVIPEPADMPKILDGIYDSLNKIVKECISGTELEYNDGSDYDATLIRNVAHNIKSKVTEMFGDNKAIQNFANDMFRDRLAGAPKVENATVQSESLGKENCSMVRHVVITDEEKVAVANKIVYDCVNKISFNHNEGEAIELLRMFEAEREATSKVVEVYGDDKVALNAIHEIFNCLYENIKQFYEGEHKEEALVEKDVTTETPTKDKYDLSPEDAEKVNQSIERIKAKTGVDTETSESLTKDKIKQLVRSKTEEVFGISNEDAINAVWSIFDRNPYYPIREEDLEIFIKRAILCYIAKEAVDYSDLRLSENKSDEQTCLSEVRKEAINKVKEIYGDDKELLDYVEKVVNLYSDFITNQKFYKEEKKHNRPMPIITKPIGRRIPGMSHIVQQRPLSTTENMDNILLSKEEQKQLKAAESDALKRDSMVDYSNPSGKDIENLITKIYGERSRKNLPKESQEQSEQKEETPEMGKLHIGLARRIALSTENAYDSPLYGITRHILEEQYPNEEYLRPYKYGLVAPFGKREERFETERELQDIHCFVWPFNSLLRYRDNWLSNYYGYGTYYDGDLKFSIHRVCMDKGKYDYVVIENSHSTRPLSFPTKDMADNFLIVFRDLIEASGNLI